MQVTVHGNKIPIKVSETGMFHSLDMKFYAPTLRGLEKKMNAGTNGPIPSTAKTPVQHKTSHKIGVVLGKKAGSYNKYRVKWADGKYAVVDIYYLRMPMAPEQIHHLEQLEQAEVSAGEVSHTAQEAVEDYESQFNIQDQLRTLYGAN